MDHVRVFGGSVRRAMAVTLTAVAVVAAAPREARADAYKDDKLGFSLNAPSKWKQSPVSTDERWIVAKFQCPRPYEAVDKQNGWYMSHTPYLDVVVIPLETAAAPGATVEKTEDGGVKIKRAQEYHDLKGYLDATLQKNSDEGFYFDKEEETQTGGMKCVQYVVNIEKNVRAPKRVFAWAYYTPDAIYGLIGDTLVQFEDKLKPDLLAAFRSFKAFPRTGKLPGAGEDDAVVVKNGDKPADLSDADRKARRDKAFTDTLAKIKSGLPEGWSVKESDHFTAVTHSDAKHTARVLEHAEALRAWLDANLGFLGSGYCGRTILRICADQDEHSAFQKTNGWSSDRIEVITYKDKEGWTDWAQQQLSRGIYGVWMNDRNEDLRWSLPHWLESGLGNMIETSVSKGRKIEFKPSTWDVVKMAEFRRAGKLLDARSFFTLTSDALWNDYETHYQADAFVRFLLIGSGSKNPKYKNVLADYMKAHLILLDEARAKRKKKDDGASGDPQSEEEESRRIKEQQDSWKLEEVENLRKLQEKTFAGWDQKEWDKFTACYWKELGV